MLHCPRQTVNIQKYIPFSLRNVHHILSIDGQRAGPARHGPVKARADGGQASTARRASRTVPLRATGLAFGLGMALWAIFRAVSAHEARPELWPC